MTLRLDPPRLVRGWRIAALVDVARHATPVGGGVVAVASKHPVALLLARDGRLLAFSPDGSPLDPVALERRHPGLHATLTGGALMRAHRATK